MVCHVWQELQPSGGLQPFLAAGLAGAAVLSVACQAAAALQRACKYVLCGVTAAAEWLFGTSVASPLLPAAAAVPPPGSTAVAGATPACHVYSQFYSCGSPYYVMGVLTPVSSLRCPFASGPAMKVLCSLLVHTPFCWTTVCAAGFLLHPKACTMLGVFAGFRYGPTYVSHSASQSAHVRQGCLYSVHRCRSAGACCPLAATVTTYGCCGWSAPVRLCAAYLPRASASTVYTAQHSTRAFCTSAMQL